MSLPSCDSLACEKQASKSVTSCSTHQGESRGSSIRAEGYLSPPASVEPGARAMPPLTGVGERCAPRATWFCIDERTCRQVALALRVYPPLSRVGPGGIACSALLA